MVGSTVSHYRIRAKLGEGGMGVVYKAEDLRLGRTAALKFLSPHPLQNEDARKRFVREAKAAAALDHPNICTLYEIDEAEGGAFMAMAYLEGQTLDARIADGPLPLPLALDVAGQIAKGLQEAHSKGISHRDIKPSNVCLLETGSKELLAKILDFGLARAAGQTALTRHDATVGTVAYMSPEQTQGSGVDHRTDIWALGVVFYEMVTGLRPFRGDYDKAIVYSITCEAPEPVTGLRSGVPMQLEWILNKALAKNPDQRYQSCVEMIVDLEAVVRQLAGEGSRVAMTGARGATRSMPQPILSSSDDPSSRKRRVRDTVLTLSSQGVLPDRILTQTLEILAEPGSDRSDELRTRNQLLNDLADERVRIGEFIEQWHELDSKEAVARAASDGSKKIKGKNERSKLEVFGIPLFHRAWGKDPATGKERVARGVFALGTISVGAVAVSRFLAVGVIAIAPVSIGLWVLGLLAIGLNAGGMLRLSLVELPWWQGVLIVLAAGLAGGFLYSRSRMSAQGVLDELALFAFRTWKGQRAPVRGGNVTAICGRYVVDLSNAALAEGSVELDVNAVLGAVRIVTPANRPVVVEGAPILGKFAGAQGARVDGPPIVVRGVAVLGAVEAGPAA